jgi:hypothetical protein
MQKIRYLDKLVDEGAKGKTIEKLLRKRRTRFYSKKNADFLANVNGT